MADMLCETMKSINWRWADKDPSALAILEERIEKTGCELGLITYSELVSGVVFHLRDGGNAKPYLIQTNDWTGIDRGIIADFLGYISMRSYCAYGFMASALVISRRESKPSDAFFDWMVTLKVLPETSNTTVLKYWTAEVAKAHNWYHANKC